MYDEETIMNFTKARNRLGQYVGSEEPFSIVTTGQDAYYYNGKMKHYETIEEIIRPSSSYVILVCKTFTIRVELDSGRQFCLYVLVTDKEDPTKFLDKFCCDTIDDYCYDELSCGIKHLF